MITNTLSTTYEKNLLFRLGSRNRCRVCRGEISASVTDCVNSTNSTKHLFIKLTTKTIRNMETKINLENTTNLSIINNKEFISWLKGEIKELAKLQKIAKRDRKDAKHPCPDQRVYSFYEAPLKVGAYRWRLRNYYALYYLLRRKRDIDWEQVSIKKECCWWSITNGREIMESELRELDPGLEISAYEMGELVKRYMSEGVNAREESKALCHCQ